MTSRTELDRAVMVGRAGPRSARIWLRSPGGGPHRLELWPQEHPSLVRAARVTLPPRPESDFTYAFELPDELTRALEPGTRYTVRVSREDGVAVGEAGFDTAPETFAQTPSRLTVALTSCHQPFDEDGSVHPESTAMLRAARTALERAETKFLIECGDQLYADYPVSQSIFRPEVLSRLGCSRDTLFDCDRDEVRRMYQARYRWMWSQPEWLALHAQLASYPILDDHEVIDNWHSEDAHLAPRFTPIREGARAAYEDYQHSRVTSRPPYDDASYHYGFDWGAVGVFVMDVRSQRFPETERRDGQVCGEAQFRELARWLEAHREFPVVLLVVSVPPLFMPEWLAWLAGRVVKKLDGDAHDRWSHPQFVRELAQLLSILHAHQARVPAQKLVICSGDVHVGYAMSCVWKGTPELVTLQLVSSALTHEMPPRELMFGTWVPRSQIHVQGEHGEKGRLHLHGEGGHRRFRGPVGELNLGLIEISLEGGKASINLKLVGSRKDAPGEPCTLLETGPL